MASLTSHRKRSSEQWQRIRQDVTLSARATAQLLLLIGYCFIFGDLIDKGESICNYPLFIHRNINKVASVQARAYHIGSAYFSNMTIFLNRK
jgi:hypothetical protein